jgi:NTE family protein
MGRAENLFNNKEELTDTLRHVHLFQMLPTPILHKIANAVTLTKLYGGETLIRQHERCSTLYILLYGRLRAFIDHGHGQEVVVGEIYATQVVGEMAILVDSPHTTTVRALRDCVLLTLTRQAFESIVTEHPEAGLEIMRLCLARHLSADRPVAQGAHAETIAIAPISSESIQFRKTAHLLQRALNEIAPTLLIDAHIFRQAAGENGSSGEPDPTHYTAWFHQQEASYTYVIYLTDHLPTKWSRWCMRQADRMLFIAEANESAQLGILEQDLPSRGSSKVYSELILLHDNQPIANTHKWLAMRPHLGGHYHVRYHNRRDLARIARTLSGTSLGVVFSGGGARGAAYIGFYRAMQELSIDIDFICGTSMGAVLASAIAQGISWQELLKRFEHAVIHYSHFDYILPVFSLLQGKNLTHLVKYMAGEETYIEDLHIPFFCHSTKISGGDLHIHQQGILWQALRASCSLPAIMPPAQDEQGNILVDGSVLNNLPVDLLKERIGGGKILAVNCSAGQNSSYFYPFNTPQISTTDILNYQIRNFPAPPHNSEILNIFNMLELLISLISHKHKLRMIKEADYFMEFDTHQYGLFEYDAFEKIVDIGYRLSMEKLPLFFPHSRREPE